jgi:hypothetical protein
MRALALILLLLAGAQPWSLQAAPEDSDRTRARGAELLQPFKKALMGALKDGLAEGPAEAVDTCHIRAPGIPAQAAPEGVELGRTSHKLRNPDNKPTEWQQAMLKHYRRSGDSSPQSRRLDNGRLAYAEPIKVKPMCVTCHGPRDEIPAAVRAKLDAQYPNDEATGFEVGDFRGIFWATWPGEAPEGES